MDVIDNATENMCDVIEAMVAMRDPVRVTDIASAIKKSDQFARKVVNDLIALGIVVKEGELKTARYRLHENITNGTEKYSFPFQGIG